MDIFRNVRLRRSRGIRRVPHARTSGLSIVQNPSCYVTASFRKLSHAQFTVSICRPAGRPIERLTERVVKRRSDIRERTEILRALWVWTECTFISVFATPTTSETPLDFDSTTWLSLCVRRAPSRDREFQRSGICPSASSSSPKFETEISSKHSI